MDKVKTIYYINIKQIRDNSEAVGHNEYKQLEEKQTVVEKVLGREEAMKISMDFTPQED